MAVKRPARGGLLTKPPANTVGSTGLRRTVATTHRVYVEGIEEWESLSAKRARGA